ncbi:hypothetical protein PV327_011549 [Microctonus hyperodae]|uniref:Uncharacterized protein n=1 Tax=Microctonus hyperodae TaxID=165561 RepID=A0AA39FH38_MICHY|nr:hypothetical protein PV327_011549 [Microctonus hyperodae]
MTSPLNFSGSSSSSSSSSFFNLFLNQVSQRNSTSVRQNVSDGVQSVEPDSNHDVNNDSTVIGSKSSTINHRNLKNNNVNDVGNNGSQIVNSDRGTSEAAASFQFLYSNSDDYPTASSTGNHVSSSQQGIEFNEDSRNILE